MVIYWEVGKVVPLWAWKIMSEARSLRACVNVGSLGSKKETKKCKNENGVMDLMRQPSVSSMWTSILWTVCASKMNPSSSELC